MRKERKKKIKSNKERKRKRGLKEGRKEGKRRDKRKQKKRICLSTAKLKGIIELNLTEMMGVLIDCWSSC